jgi:hypothetical protein
VANTGFGGLSVGVDAERGKMLKKRAEDRALRQVRTALLSAQECGVVESEQSCDQSGVG